MTNDLILSASAGLARHDASLAEALGDFLRLNVAAGDAAPATVRSYMSEAASFADWAHEAGIEPARATTRDLIEYRAYLVSAGFARGTIATKLAALRRLYQAATWHGLRPDNPAAGLKAPPDRTDRADKIKYLPLAGFRRLLAAPDAATDAGARDKALLALLGYHGLRVHEAAGLELAGLELAGADPRLTVIGKGAKPRTVHLIEESREALAGWLDRREALAAPGCEAVFISLANRNHGQPVTPRALRYIVDRYLADLGLKREGVSCHSLRHSFATWAYASGASLRQIGAVLGHANENTTAGYAQLYDRITDNPARRLAALLGE